MSQRNGSLLTVFESPGEIAELQRRAAALAIPTPSAASPVFAR